MPLIVAILLAFAGLPQQTVSLGRVEGVVVDAANKPIKGASVYADNLNLSIRGIRPTVLTDAQGQFVLEDVYPGQLLIHAYKDADKYADMFQFGMPSAMPRVELKAGEVVKGVVIRFDKKAGSLQLHTLDASTNEPIKGIEIQMCHADHVGDRMYCMTGTVRGNYQMFVPPGVPISIKVSAPDHKEWTYQDAAKKPYIVLASGEERTVTINLQPINLQPVTK